MDRGYFFGKKVLIMGLGRFGGGVDAAGFAYQMGAKVKVTDVASAQQLADSVKQLEGFANIEFCLGGHRRSDFEQADIVIVNPAVPKDSDLLQTARSRGSVITSRVNIFFELCPAVIIGIPTTPFILLARLRKQPGGNIMGGTI